MIVLPASPETPLDLFLLIVALGGLCTGMVGILLAIGDLRIARTEQVPQNPVVTAAIESLIISHIRVSQMLVILWLVLVRLFDRSQTQGAIVAVVLWITLTQFVAITLGILSRRRITRQTEALIDPCADCPLDNSPFRSKAQHLRTRRALHGVHQDIITPNADVHVLITPHQFSETESEHKE